MDKKNIFILSVICIVCIISIGLAVGILTTTGDKDKNNIVSGEVLGVQDIISDEKPLEISGETSGDEKKEEYLGPKIFSGDARPIAVMIDNEKGAWPQAGLNDAYMIYEITVEGGETRFIALFKGQTTSKIGPVRSSRHYFLDYALEHDAIYVHFGWSPLAQSDIKSLKINNINGIYDNFYWREQPLSSYHNAFTSMSNIMEYATRKQYRLTSDDKCIINYNEKDENIESEMVANKVYIKYSYTQNSSHTP